uniref:DUF7927 domain-containing protein n=1 Tax=Cellulomonas hominis TaxID=156981 RepID=UPI0018ABB3DB|nr:SpaA isopeptide-forming pilin-related protein [Cellulomonas hominis]
MLAVGITALLPLAGLGPLAADGPATAAVPTWNNGTYQVFTAAPFGPGPAAVDFTHGPAHTATVTAVPDASAPHFLAPGGQADGRTTSVSPISADSGNGTSDDPWWNDATSDCLIEPAGWSSSDPWYTSGRTVECGTTHTVTLDFDAPVVDPVVRIALPGWTKAGGENACYATWSNTSFASVNGSAAEPGRVTRLTDSSGAGFTDNRVDGTPATWDRWNADGCTPDTVWPVASSSWSFYQVSGYVSSITFEWQQVAKIVFSTGVEWDATLAAPGPAYSVMGAVSDLQITKSGTATVPPGGDVEWELAVTNSAQSAPSHGFVVTDAVPAGVTDVALVSAPDGCTLSGSDLVCTGAAPGWQITDPHATPLTLTGGDPSATVGAALDPGGSFGPIRLRATATAPAGTSLPNTAAVVGVDYDPDMTNNTAGSTTLVVAPTWAVSKSAAIPGGRAYAQPGEVITYTVTATSYGSSDVSGVKLRDDLTNVLASANIVPGSVRLTYDERYLVFWTRPVIKTLPDPSAASPIITAPAFVLLADSTATLTYQVTVKPGAWSAVLENTVNATGSRPPGTCAAREAPVPVCSTYTVVAARLELVKRGTVNGSVVPLDGAAFEVLTDSGDAPGPPASVVVAASATQPGAFEIAGIVPGTYWLRETRAPAGHDLLAQAVRFTVDDVGIVTLSDPAAHTQITTDGGQIVVTDSPRFTLPATGGPGTGWFTWTGLLLTTTALAVGVALCSSSLGHGARCSGRRDEEGSPTT